MKFCAFEKLSTAFIDCHLKKLPLADASPEAAESLFLVQSGRKLVHPVLLKINMQSKAVSKKPSFLRECHYNQRVGHSGSNKKKRKEFNSSQPCVLRSVQAELDCRIIRIIHCLTEFVYDFP